MKTLTVTALLCAVMALTTAAREHQVVERSTCCPDGWRKINGRCFLYVPRAQSWAHAERNCQSMGANLASIHQALEQDEIKRMIQDVTHGHPETWIGGSDAEEEGFWLWSDGTPFRFSYWCSREPNNSQGQQHCLQIHYGDNKCWDDKECSDNLPSVCAKNI
ncbi:ladderlectin-like [Centropristis striata]|uniref:ladderlectin-like n=1 Tax=Centropristis striata TaxID=184440 RepID=UPI0027DF2841|nr:ladderlectin-like [Centropristis striata]